MAKQLSSKTEPSFPKKNKKELDQKPIEVTLWDAANKLRGSVEPAEYKHVVLSLIFLKFASDKFEQQRQTFVSVRPDENGNLITRDLFMSAGIGMRTFVLGLPSRVDVAWRNLY